MRAGSLQRELSNVTYSLIFIGKEELLNTRKLEATLSRSQLQGYVQVRTLWLRGDVAT